MERFVECRVGWPSLASHADFLYDTAEVEHSDVVCKSRLAKRIGKAGNTRNPSVDITPVSHPVSSTRESAEHSMPTAVHGSMRNSW